MNRRGLAVRPRRRRAIGRRYGLIWLAVALAAAAVALATAVAYDWPSDHPGLVTGPA